MARAASLMTTTSSSSDTMPWASSTSIRARTLFLRCMLEFVKSTTKFRLFQVRKDYEALKSHGKDFPILMTSRDNILAQKSQDPDPNEALRYYQATFNYTENLREVLENLRLRIV